MSDEQDQDRELEARLEEAARWCQPRHPGWQTLRDRLGQQETVAAPRSTGREAAGRAHARSLRQRLLTLAAGLLAAASLVTVISLLTRQGIEPRTVAANLDVEVQRRGIDVTIFNPSENQEPTLYMPVVGWGGAVNQTPQSGTTVQLPSFSYVQVDQSSLVNAQSLQVDANVQGGRLASEAAGLGMGLVKDQRMVLHLKQGDNIVKFTDVAASIDPTSVRLVSETDPAGIQVVEQNFEFDLASADGLLKRSLERRVTCIGKNEQSAIDGFLLSYDAETLVLADRAPDPDPKAPRPKTQTVARSTLKAIRLDEMPKDLYTRPTLVWKLRAKTPGDHLTTLSYLCGNMAWQADYVVTILKSDPEAGDTLDLTGWVSIDNRCGATFDQAGLKLIAGDVNRVRDPWAPVPVQTETVDDFSVQELVVLAIPPPKELIAKDFFEYKLYTLSQPSTVKDRQIKQLSLLTAHNVTAQRRYRFDRGGSPLTTELVVKNEKANGLGRPLPKGRVAFVALDADGEGQLLGRDHIDHTPKDETLELKLGQAFDVTGGFSTVSSKSPHAGRLIETYEIRVRNHKDVPINVRAVGHLHGERNWQVTKTTDDYVKHDFRTLYFDFRMKANSEKTITYTVDYQR